MITQSVPSACLCHVLANLSKISKNYKLFFLAVKQQQQKNKVIIEFKYTQVFIQHPSTKACKQKKNTFINCKLACDAFN